MSGTDSSKTNQSNDENLDYLAYLKKVDHIKKWPYIREWLKDRPHAFFTQLREEQPILVTPECTLLALYDDVIEALNQPTLFTVSLYKPKMGDFLMTEDDTPLHNYDRDVMMSLLKREDLPRIRQYIANESQNILNRCNGEICLQ